MFHKQELIKKIFFRYVAFDQVQNLCSQPLESPCISLAEAHKMTGPTHPSNEQYQQQQQEQPASLDGYSKVGLVDPGPSSIHHRGDPSHGGWTAPNHQFHYSSPIDLQPQSNQLQQSGNDACLSKNPHTFGEPSSIDVEKATAPSLSESLQLQVGKVTSDFTFFV